MEVSTLNFLFNSYIKTEVLNFGFYIYGGSMNTTKEWFYDYENKCDCSDDDRCGCTYPNNMKRNYSYHDINVKQNNRIPYQNRVYVGGVAPDFSAMAIMPDMSVNKNFCFFNFIDCKYAILFFYPADFSKVCPTEIIALNRMYKEFCKRNVKVVAISVDSIYSHVAWRKMAISDGGIGDINFPLVSDINKEISFDYGVLTPDGVSQRATFIIDDKYVIRHILINDVQVRREVSETLKIIDVLQAVDKNNSVCMANWSNNQSNFFVSAEGQAEYLNQD